MAVQIETKLYRCDCVSMLNKNFPTVFDVSYIVWQPYWIEGKILNNVYSETTASINVRLHNYDQLDMWNGCFKFQPRQPQCLAGRII